MKEPEVGACVSQRVPVVRHSLAAFLLAHLGTQLRPRSARVTHIMLQLGLALRHLAAHGVCHRDVRLETILVDESMRIQLSHFECACSRSDRDPVGMMLKLPPLHPDSMPTRAPEVLLGAHDCMLMHMASDVWSLGCVYAHLLNGQQVAVFATTLGREPGMPTEEPQMSSVMLARLFRNLGTPSIRAMNVIIGGESPSAAKPLPKTILRKSWSRIVKHKRLSQAEVRMLNSMLDWNPETRIPAAALHEYFDTKGSSKARLPRNRLLEVIEEHPDMPAGESGTDRGEATASESQPRL